MIPKTLLTMGSCAVLAACSQERELRIIELPPLPAEAKSVVLVIDSEVAPTPPSERLMLRAYSLGALASSTLTLDFEQAPTSQVHLLVYPRSLESLGLEEGPIVLAGPEGRGMPEPSQSLAWLEPADGVGWRDERFPDELRQLRIAHLDFILCLQRSGCLVGDGDTLLCELPCDPGPEPLPPAPPAASTPPSIWREVCPVGTATATLGSIPLAVCDPRQTQSSCGPSAALHPSSLACVSLDGPNCPRFAAIPIGMTAVYVDPTSPPGGDGSIGSPFITVAAAVAASNDGEAIALAAGTYHDPLILAGDRSLLGACAATTNVGRITFLGNGTLAGVRLENEGVVIGPGTEVRLDTVAITGGTIGISVDGGRASGRGVVVRYATTAIEVVNGGYLELASAYLEGATDSALRVEGLGTRATLSDLVVRGGFHWSVTASGGAGLTLNRALIEGGGEGGLRSKGATTSVEVSDLVVRDFTASARGMIAEEGGTILAHNLRISRITGSGLVIAARSDATVEDLQISNIIPQLGFLGRGIDVEAGGRLELSRAHIDTVPRSGIALHAGAMGLISDLVARDAFETELSSGIEIDGGHLELDRAQFFGTTPTGLNLAGLNSYARVTDVEIDVSAGAITVSQVGSNLIGERLWLHDNYAWGLSTGDGARTEVQDLLISKVGTSVSVGSGLSAKLLEPVIVDRFVIEDCGSWATDLSLIELDQSEKRLTHGRIRRNHIAMKIMPLLANMLENFDHVVFEDNEQLFAD